MIQHKQAFTLIELLVVVLIIGILAAVALPQYQRAVRKSRAGQILSLVRSLALAQELYYLANNKYADTFEELDVQIPGPEVECSSQTMSLCHAIGAWEVGMQKGISDEEAYAIAAHLENMSSIISYLEHKKNNVIRQNASAVVCSTSIENQDGKALCIGLGGKYMQDYVGVTYYSL
ncbi:MAG: prepilin-type N-terminal cleavage/methylation domain-containing protein [Elusimicrobiaceae bacterium]|nr:prepilin-type N-terminal cleavage/methylation domain-containing protein [Elusimicrobiaceae bacterium]